VARADLAEAAECILALFGADGDNADAIAGALLIARHLIDRKG